MGRLGTQQQLLRHRRQRESFGIATGSDCPAQEEHGWHFSRAPTLARRPGESLTLITCAIACEYNKNIAWPPLTLGPRLPLAPSQPPGRSARSWGTLILPLLSPLPQTTAPTNKNSGAPSLHLLSPPSTSCFPLSSQPLHLFPRSMIVPHLEGCGYLQCLCI